MVTSGCLRKGLHTEVVNADPNPILLPLAGILRQRGVRVILDCRLDRDVVDQIRSGGRMRELSITAPVFAFHRLHADRRMVIGIEQSLQSWRERLRSRGINLLSVSEDGLLANASGIADQICAHLYRVSVEDLKEMVQAGMPKAAIRAFTGIKESELTRMVPRFYGRTFQELREQGNE